MSRTVLLVAKAPVPGRTKTRLVPPLTHEQAAALHRALLLDTLDACRAEVPETGLLHAGGNERELLGALVGAETRLVAQDGEGLGDALRSGLAGRLGSGPVALVSSDIPGLPPGELTRAFAALERGSDVVLGPALDGGYWLIAMRELHDELLRDMPWSTPAVLAVTLDRCREAGLRARLVEPWRDVDTLADVSALARATPEGAARTRAVVRELVAEHRLDDEPPPTLVESTLLAASPWRAIVRDRLLAGEREAEYTYLAVPRAVFVAPITDDGELLLVRQYRHPVREWTLEVPAGSVRDGETPVDAAARELAEEAGGRAREWQHLTTFYSSSAHISLRSEAFLATGVEVGLAAPEDGEEVTVVRMPFAEAVERARAGGFVEGQTALTILLAAERFRGSAIDETIRTRRTHKAYGPEPVPRAQLEELLELARWAPNHRLTNPWRFRVLGPATLARLKEAAGPAEAAKLDRAPTLVVASAHLTGDLVQDEEDVCATACAVYAVLLAAHARGLAGYWRTPAVLRTPAGRDAVGLPDGERFLALIHLGTPRRTQPPPGGREPPSAYVGFLD